MNSDLADSESDNRVGTPEKREAAYQEILAATEPYINAHRAAASIPDDVENVYVPDLQEAETAVERANGQFVAARLRIEQHGTKSILDATLAIEDAVNSGELDRASHLRRDRLVPAIRKDMNRPTSASWQ